MGSKLDTNELYESVLPVLGELEQDRELARAAVQKANMFMAGIVVAGALVGLMIGGGGSGFPMVIFGAVAGLILGGFVRGMISGKAVEHFKRRFKTTVVREVILRSHPGLRYSPDSGISESVFNSAGFFSSPDRYSCEDGISGKIGDTEVWFSEVHAEERRRSKNRTYYVTLFDGVFMVADFHKHFRGTVRVVPDTAEKLFGIFGKTLQSFRPLSDEKLVYLEDPEFEKEFVVYGTDQVEARYILSTSMVGRILDLKAKWGDNVRLAFSGSSVFVAISNAKNLLEPDLRKPVSDRDQIIHFAYELELCFSIIEDLNLNTRIWTKE